MRMFLLLFAFATLWSNEKKREEGKGKRAKGEGERGGEKNLTFATNPLRLAFAKRSQITRARF